MDQDSSSTPAAHGTLLAIEDDSLSMELLAGLLEDQPQVRLLKAYDAAEGVRLALEEAPDLVLLDMHLGGSSGIEVVRALNEPIAEGRFDVILLTGDSLTIEVLKAMSLGAREYWPKPVRLPRVLAALARAVARPRLS